MRRLGVASCVAVALLALGACAGDSDDLESPDSPVAHYDWDSGWGMDALVLGTLELREGCLYLVDGPRSGTQDYVTVPVFPRSYAQWDDAAQTLTYGDETFSPGDEISAHGGEVPANDHLVVPGACDLGSEGTVFLIQTNDISP